MPLSQINLGTTPNDKTGDSLRVAGLKINTGLSQVDALTTLTGTQGSSISAQATLLAAVQAILANTAIPTFQQVNTPTTFALSTGLDQETDNAGRNVYNAKVGVAQPTDDYLLISTGIPLINPPNLTMGNNGAFTLSVALDAAYANAYMYLPASAIYSGSQHGIYFVQMSSTTVGQVFNNKYLFGQPTIPSSPTAFVSSGPGPITMPATGVIGWSSNVPANGMGVNGELEIIVGWTRVNSTALTGVSHTFGGQNILGSDNQSSATVPSRCTRNIIRNRGVANAQVAITNANGDIGTGTGYATGSVDTTKHKELNLNMNNSTPASAWNIIQHYSARIWPSHKKDTGHTPLLTTASSSIVPPGASAVGCNVNKIFVNPQGSDVSFSPSDTTHNLYAGLWYQPQPPYTTAHVSTVNGMLAINNLGDGVTPNVATVNQNSGSTGLGALLPLLPSSNAWYVEAAITLSSNDQDHFPGFYVLPIEHNTGTTTYVEVDIDEAGYDKDSNDPAYNSINSVVNWVSGTPTIFNNDTGGIGGQLYGPNIDRTKEHIFGASYDPTAKLVTFWVDGVQQPFQQSTAAFDSSISPFHYYVIFDASSHGANIAYSMYVRYFSAWQRV